MTQPQDGAGGPEEQPGPVDSAASEQETPEPASEVDMLLQQEIEAERLRSDWREPPAQPRRRGWFLLLAVMLALGCAVAYYLKLQSEPDKLKLLAFVSLYLTFPLSLSVILLFAYFRYPAR